VLLDSHRPDGRVLVFTSAQPGEGKSTIAANLAVELARAGKAVALVDADLRLPTIHQIFDLPNDQGLSGVLRGDVSLDAAVRPLPSHGIQVLTAGQQVGDPAELLGSDRMAELLAELERRFDLVLVDTPSLLAVADGAMLLPAADELLLVIAQGRATVDAVRAACQQFAGAQVQPVVVVNRVDLGRGYGYYNAYRAV
jgi:capsular exopolysaccharide synthesis family protein